MENVNHVTKEEALEAAIEALKMAAETDHFMAAVWSVKDGRIGLNRNTTWQFPTDDFDAAIGHLRDICREEKTSCDMPSFGPLPIADYLPKNPPPEEAPPNREIREGTILHMEPRAFPKSPPSLNGEPLAPHFKKPDGESITPKITNPSHHGECE